MENIIHIDLNIESILKQLDIRLNKFSSIYKEEIGDNIRRATDIGNNVNASPIRIYLADSFIEAKREFTKETSLVSNGYKIVRKGE